MLVISHSAVWVPLLFCLTAIIYYCLAIYSTLDFLQQSFSIDPEFHPPITILKPLCGVDQHAYENLASFCRQDYPIYQIVFAVQDLNDPSIAIVKQLMRDFPEVDIDLVISDRAIGENLKVSNLANAAALAKHSIFLSADSDVYVARDFLMQVVQPLRQPKVGVVSCLYRSRAQGWISTFHALGISTEYAPTNLVSRKLKGMDFALGACLLIRKSVLHSVGGFAAVADYLREDYLLGNLPSQSGYQVVLASYIVEHEWATKTIFDFVQHSIRWNYSVRIPNPWGYLGLIFTFGTMASLLFLLTMQGTALSWGVLAVTWLFRLAMAWVVGVKALQDPVVKRYWWLIPFSDLVRFGLWCVGFVGNTVEWRGRRLHLTKDGKLVELTLA